MVLLLDLYIVLLLFPGRHDDQTGVVGRIILSDVIQF